MIGVLSASSPEKAASRVFQQRLKGKKKSTGITKEESLEIHIRDLGAGDDNHFRVWTEIFAKKESEAIKEGDGKKARKKLVIKKIN